MNRTLRMTAMFAASVLWTGAVRAYAGTLPLFGQIKVSEAGGKNYVVEGVVTVALMGLALFVVCKTSRRT